jgi:hypothetical protein
LRLLDCAKISRREVIPKYVDSARRVPPNWCDRREAARFIFRRTCKIMRVRKFAIALVIVAAMGSGGLFVGSAGAQMAANPARTASSLSAAGKEKLLQKLKDAKKLDKEARKGTSQEASTQAAYDEKIKDINRLITKLGKDEDFPLSDVDKAVALPGKAPH